MQELLDYTEKGYTINPLVLFSGPYGTNVQIGEYKSVLIVASGFSIAAFILYLKRLIYSYNTCIVQACRIYLV